MYIRDDNGDEFYIHTLKEQVDASAKDEPHGGERLPTGKARSSRLDKEMGDAKDDNTSCGKDCEQRDC